MVAPIQSNMFIFSFFCVDIEQILRDDQNGILPSLTTTTKRSRALSAPLSYDFPPIAIGGLAFSALLLCFSVYCLTRELSLPSTSSTSDHKSSSSLTQSILVGLGAALAIAALVCSALSLSMVQIRIGTQLMSTSSGASGRKAGATVAMVVAAALSAAAGTGGGGIYTALQMAIMTPQDYPILAASGNMATSLTAHSVIPTSYAVVLGVAVGSVTFLLPALHPYVHRSLIDFALCLVAEPWALAGLVCGVAVGASLPSVVMALILSAVLCLSCLKTLQKGLQTWKREQRGETTSTPEYKDDVTKSQVRLLTHEEMTTPLIAPEEDENMSIFLDGGKEERHRRKIASFSPKIADALEEERRFPWFRLLLLSGLWLVSSLMLFFRSYSVACGSPVYIALTSILLLILLGSGTAASIWTLSQHRSLQNMHFPFLSSDWRLHGKKSIAINAVGHFGSGLFSGIVGISGGMLQGPLLLSQGLLPQVVAASISFLVLFSSASACAHYVATQQIDLPSAIYAFTTGFVAALLGQTGLHALVRTWKRQSIICFLLAALIFVAASSMAISAILNIARGTASFALSAPCSPAR